MSALYSSSTATGESGGNPGNPQSWHGAWPRCRKASGPRWSSMTSSVNRIRSTTAGGGRRDRHTRRRPLEKPLSVERAARLGRPKERRASTEQERSQ